MKTLLLRPGALRAFFLLVLCLPTASSLWAQAAGSGTVRGRVFNPVNGEYVRNAEIRLEGTNRVA